jgi:membrane-bound ClpP family serine protease
MLKHYKTQTNIGTGVGLVAQVLGFVMLDSEKSAPVGLVFILVGAALFIWGCVSYAKGKGHSGFLGILGLLHILGLLVLILLPDRHKNGGALGDSRAAAPPDQGLDALERLAVLREKGVLTQDEFEKKKRELMR